MAESNSKKIYLKRNRPFVHEQMMSEEVQEALSHSRRGIGSFFAGKHTTKKGTGLNDMETKILLPHVLDVTPEEPEFRRKVDSFYTEISTNVPFKTGLELEIGLENSPETIEEVKTGKSKLSKANMPLNIDDYIKFRHAMAYPGTVISPTLAKGNQLAEYYFEDPTEVSTRELDELNTADQALNDYQRIKDSPDKVEMIVTLMRHWIPKKVGKPAVVVGLLTQTEKLIVLRELAQVQPAKFHEITNDETLKNKYIVDELISVNLLKRVGSTIMLEETGDSIGESLKEAAAYLFSPKQTQLLNNLKAAYKEKNKKSALSNNIKTEELTQ